MRVRSRDTLKFGSSTSIRANAWWTRRSEAPRSASSSLNVGSTSSRVHRVTTNPDSRSSSGPMPGRGAATGAPPPERADATLYSWRSAAALSRRVPTLAMTG
jgi:hypothetical protein